MRSRLTLLLLVIAACAERTPGGGGPDASIVDALMVWPDTYVLGDAAPDATTGGCRTNADCGDFVPEDCLMTAPNVCGIPCPDGTTSNCAADGECGGGGMICDPPQCCPDLLQCRQGCVSDGECIEPGSICSLGRCVASSCASIPCPANADCALVPGPGPLCLPRTCGGDGDCDHPGFCVDGRCENSLGMCYVTNPP